MGYRNILVTLDGTRSEVFMVINFDKKLVLIGYGRHVT
jgi:hypothetical protein